MMSRCLGAGGGGQNEFSSTPSATFSRGESPSAVFDNEKLLGRARMSACFSYAT